MLLASGAGGTLSNAFLKSRYMTSTGSPLLRHLNKKKLCGVKLIDYIYVWIYSIVLCLKYIIGSTDMLISCHMRNNNYELCEVWIFENKIANITCAYMNENVLQIPINQITQISL